MKLISLVLLLVSVGCSVSTAFLTSDPAGSHNSLIPHQRQQLDLFASSRRLIEQLVETLRKAARDASDAIVKFSAAIQEEAISIRNRIVSNIQKLRERVINAIESVRNRLINSGVAIVDCIGSHSGDANVLFNETVSKTMTCVDNRITEVGDQIFTLKSLANSAMDFGNTALEDMRKCTDENANFIAIGSCLGTITMQAELKAMVFSTQSAFAIGRINLSIATLPAALEVCAGSRLVDTGMSSARILMDIGTCSATSVFTTMTGNVQSTLNLSNSPVGEVGAQVIRSFNV